MLFNSAVFIFLFLPITFIVFYTFSHFKAFQYAKLTLIVASFIFYAYWDYRYVALLMFSLLVNYGFGALLAKYHHSKPILTAGVIFNLSMLGFFKYTDFFISSVNQAAGTSYPLLNIVLPLGISFITFQKIAFLVDSYKEPTRYNFFDFILFVSFFPQLIAGPIVHHKDIIPQFERTDTFKVHHQNIATGLFFFSSGLFKKVVIADTLAGWATPGFDLAHSLSFVEAWTVALSYTFQLFYDFSGYSEMAIGLGFLFNVKLPYNFLSPYKSNNIIDFWRTWHITLSTFLRNYLYIPLGGNRKGKIRRYINLFLTMLLGGLWHGAGWTFVWWGSLHGVYLIINHTFRAIVGKKENTSLLTIIPSRILTFIAVVAAWVFFRAHTFGDAFKVLKGMAGMNGIHLTNLAYMPHGKYELLALAVLFLWIQLAPNTVELSKKLKPTFPWLAVTVGAFVISFLLINRISEFIYFQF